MNIFLVTLGSLPALSLKLSQNRENNSFPNNNVATSDSELQPSDSEDPDDSEDDAQSDSSEMGEFIEHSYDVLFVPDTDVEYVTVHSN